MWWWVCLVVLALVICMGEVAHSESLPEGGVFTHLTPDSSYFLCFQEPFNRFSTSLETIFNTLCPDPEWIVGCRFRSQSNLTVAARVDRALLYSLFQTQNDSVIIANNVSWYLGSDSSFGFAPANAPISRVSCDYDFFINQSFPEQRFCMQTKAGVLDAGFRCGASTFLTNNPDYDRVVFQRQPPTRIPSQHPSVVPTAASPTRSPTESPVYSTPTQSPSRTPSFETPTLSPEFSLPTQSPTGLPSQSPGFNTSVPSQEPSHAPSHGPSRVPSHGPSLGPSLVPSSTPTLVPTNSPTYSPSSLPSSTPTHSPSNSPTHSPTNLPSHSPTNSPTNLPTQSPSFTPTTSLPSALPSHTPTNSFPTRQPTPPTTFRPTLKPTVFPSKSPSVSLPTTSPTPIDQFFPGVKQNLNPQQFTKWTECWSEDYDVKLQTTFTHLFNELCTQRRLMFACGNSTMWIVAANAMREDVMFPTQGNQVHLANHVNWYFQPSRSFGYANQGLSVNLEDCDTILDRDPSQRVCVHGRRVNDTDFVDFGYRCGSYIREGASPFNRIFFQTDENEYEV